MPPVPPLDLPLLFEAFLRDHYPDGHRLQQGNDPKHASHRIEEFLSNVVLIGGRHPQLSSLLIVFLTLETI